MSNRLYVGNLSYDTTEMDLRDLFGKSGEVTEVKMMLDRETGRPRGFAFVEMATGAAAQTAVSDLHGRELGGRTLKVSPAQERSEGGGNRGPSNNRGRW